MSETAQVFDFQQARAKRAARASEGWVSKRQIAVHFSVSVRTIENWMRAGMPFCKRYPNSHAKFRVGECDEWFAGRAS